MKQDIQALLELGLFVSYVGISYAAFRNALRDPPGEYNSDLTFHIFSAIVAWFWPIVVIYCIPRIIRDIRTRIRK